MALLLRGGSLENFIAIRENDLLGNDPGAAWGQGCRELDRAIAEPGALARMVEYRTGPITGRTLLDVRIFDLLVHTWHLARSIGVDERLDDNLVTWALEQSAGPLQFMSQAFSDVRPTPVDGSDQEHLLRLCGRSSEAH